jgi:hypothetical protein
LVGILYSQLDQVFEGASLGLVTSYTMGGLIHVLLIVAIVVILVRVIQGQR